MSDTAVIYVPVGQLVAGMRVSARPNEPLREVEDIAQLDSTGRSRVTLSDEVEHRNIVEVYEPTAMLEVHLTLNEAVAEYYRLDREEAAALQRGYDLGEQRAHMARLAQSLGWRG